ncbi:neuronal acetylcholine receptor subunit non-alpha-3-like isoform X2 [Anopheles funestus]|uniref:neuronal acetylcholine receptor subunit non-alpha-3-like isoform X2 n=1 Tax=Anopheles funestus TaxID=62324 RepID=UPI0020C6D7FA|nr:neuronal acetylcholine receptor subunit non-alpha-3-like isoform X2 [Anopheles funestus]
MFGHGLATSSIVFLLGWITLLLNHVLPAASFECGKESVNVENRLKSALLCNGYRTHTRPRKDNTQSVNVTLSYYVLTYDFDETDDLLKLGVWMDLQWTDEFLSWNSTQWSGIERLAINSEEIWLPDFRHYSSYYNPEELPDCANPKCSVAMNGTVICLPVCSMNAKCDADYSRWPFDTVRCSMWYGTWSHSMDEVDIHTVDVCLGRNYEFQSAKWGVVSLEKGRSTLQADKYIYPVLNIDVLLIRRASFEHVAIVGPILVLAILNAYIVWLRSSSFERKVLLALSTFSHFSYLKQLEWALPFSRDTLPSCMIFLTCSTVLSVVLLILTLLNCWIRTRRYDASVTGSFIDRITGSFSQSRVAELLLAADYLELNYTVDVTLEEKDNFWARFGKLFDRALAIVCVIVYVVLTFLFIPFSHRLVERSGVNCLISA